MWWEFLLWIIISFSLTLIAQIGLLICQTSTPAAQSNILTVLQSVDILIEQVHKRKMQYVKQVNEMPLFIVSFICFHSISSIITKLLDYICVFQLGKPMDNFTCLLKENYWGRMLLICLQYVYVYLSTLFRLSPRSFEINSLIITWTKHFIFISNTEILHF